MKRFVSTFIAGVFLIKVSVGLAQIDFKVRMIEIAGNEHYSDLILQKLMLTRSYNWLTRNHYKSHLLEDDLAAIIQFYRDEGYLEAAIENFEVISDSLKKNIVIKIQITEGERTKIAGISFFGNQTFPDSMLFRLIKSSHEAPYKKSVLENDRIKLLTHYADHGFIEAKVEPGFKLSAEAHKILIDFNIQEGPRVIIGNLKISGTKRTKDFAILRELEFKQGDVYSYGKILQSQRNLYLTGLFNSVFIHPEEKSSELQTMRDIRIEANEKQGGELNFGIGYGSLERVRGSIELLHNNLMGTGRQAGLSGSASSIARRIELSYTEPWLFSTRTKADINALIERREEPAYDLQRYGGKFTLGRKFDDYSRFNLAYRYEISKLSTEASTINLKPEEKGNIRGLIFSLIRDSRDNMINTSRGSFSSLDIEGAGAFLKGTSTFLRLTIRQKYFYPVGRRFIFGTSFTLGWMDKFGASKEIPINERFFTGGATSVRGFKEKYLGPENESNDPIGGKILINLNLLEFRYTFYKKLSTVLFLDMGNVWANHDDFLKLGFRKGLGMGARYNSPLGILRFDYGIKLDRRTGESFGEFYFSVGQAF